MKPNFALSLSYEGIGLLRRVDTGWHLLGEVALDADDLTADLAGLRDMAVALEGDTFCTKLILPSDQIKYLTLETGRQSEAKRRIAAETALEDSTPYKVGDLVFEIAKDGRRTHVAAVARETLAEAEAFATEHAFNPVCFVSIPAPDAFPTEPQFGSTQFAATLPGLTFQQDNDPVQIVSSGPLPELQAPEVFELAPYQTSPEAPHAASSETPPEILPEILPEAPSEDLLRSADAPVEEIDIPEASLADQPKPAPITPKVEATKETPPVSEPSATSDRVDDAADDPVPTAAFSSIRAQRTAPQPQPSTQTQTSAPRLVGERRGVDGTNAPNLPPASDTGSNTGTSFSEQSTVRFDPAKLVAGFKVTSDDITPLDASLDKKTTSFFSRRSEATTDKVAVTPTADQTETHPPATGSASGQQSKTAAQAKDKPKRTAFASVPSEDIGGKPRYLGVVLTFVLLVFLAAVASWASIYLDDGISSLFRRDADRNNRITVIEPAPLPGDTIPQSQIPKPATAAPASETLEVVVIPEGHNDKRAVETVLITPTSVETFATPPEKDTLEEDIAHLATPSPQMAKARYAVTGIWERAPEQPMTPATDSTDTLYIASIDAEISETDALALPPADQIVHDAPLPRQLAAPAAGTTFDLDDRGLVIATKEGALSPQGVIVYLGKPPSIPAAFPVRAVPEDTNANTEDLARLADRRPRARPNNLVEQNERATNSGLSRAELGNKRPSLRPDTKKIAEEQDLTPTKLAVKTSIKPRIRPSNFAQIAARTKAPTPVVASPISATVTPSIPSKTSVTRQATIKNAINLKKVNLIGVYGTSSSRRALVRLSSGRYKKVKVGDRIDGGKVAAIGETELRYVKSGKNMVLKLPKG